MNHNLSGNSPATLPKTLRATAKQEGQYLRTMCFGVLFTAAVIGAVGALSALLETVPLRVVENSAFSAQANAIGTIVVHPGAKGCQTKTFDNRTGEIFETSTPCQNEAPLDAKGMPVPLGTVRTMNSISNSFR